MIRTFSNKELFKLFNGDGSTKIASEFHKRILRILDLLNASQRVSDMKVPGLNLHQLTGDRSGFFAVSVNGPWRIVFRFDGVDVLDVDFVQYH